MSKGLTHLGQMPVIFTAISERSGNGGRGHMDERDISFFDTNAEWSVVERGLPHWFQPGCLVFITWRLADSLPLHVHASIDAEIARCLRAAELDPASDWKIQLASHHPEKRGKLLWQLFAIRDKYLDRGYGKCQLANPEDAATVMASLKKFDNERYLVTDAVVMPNHLHLLCTFANAELMLKQCAEWKRYTGRQINQRNGRCGEFWQVDQFDHLVRSPGQFEHYRRYIAANPRKARLPAGAYNHYQRKFT